MKRTVLALLMVIAVALAFNATAYAQEKAPGVVILKGAPLGGVKLDHAAHSKRQGVACTACHHPSKPEKPMKAAQEPCSDCHTKVATAPMKTKLQAAFHDPMAKKGVCVDCHVKENAGGKTKAPTTCTGCHKKQNV